MKHEDLPRMHTMPIGEEIDKETEVLYCANVTAQVKHRMESTPGFMAVIFDHKGNPSVATAFNSREMRVGDIAVMHNMVYNWLKDWAQAAAQDLTNFQSFQATNGSPEE